MTTINQTDRHCSALHLYGQYAHHSPAIIAGSKDELFNLGLALLKAANDGCAVFDTFAADGEGYTITINRAEPNDYMPMPYTADFASSDNESFAKAFWNKTS